MDLNWKSKNANEAIDCLKKEGVKGFYPAFDYTPPHLVSAIITDLGIFSPYDVFKYYENNSEGEY